LQQGWMMTSVAVGLRDHHHRGYAQVDNHRGYLADNHVGGGRYNRRGRVADRGPCRRRRRHTGRSRDGRPPPPHGGGPDDDDALLPPSEAAARRAARPIEWGDVNREPTVPSQQRRPQGGL
jgi:hypothetical protein